MEHPKIIVTLAVILVVVVLLIALLVVKGMRRKPRARISEKNWRKLDEEPEFFEFCDEIDESSYTPDSVRVGMAENLPPSPLKEEKEVEDVQGEEVNECPPVTHSEERFTPTDENFSREEPEVEHNVPSATESSKEDAEEDREEKVVPANDAVAGFENSSWEDRALDNALYLEFFENMCKMQEDQKGRGKNDSGFNIPMVALPRYNIPKSIIQIVNLNPRHTIEVVGKKAVVYPHHIFDMVTGEEVVRTQNGWQVCAGQRLAITLGIKLVGNGVAANFIPAEIDYLKFSSALVNLSDFVASKATITVEAEVLEDSYILRDFGIGRIKLS